LRSDGELEHVLSLNKRRKDLTHRAQRSDTEFAEKKERNLFALRGAGH